MIFLPKKMTIGVFVLLLTSAITAYANPSITPGTALDIRIFGVPGQEQSTFNGLRSVDPSGFLYLPHLDEGIKASGLSSAALARKIEKAYINAEIYTNPRISIISHKDEEAQKIDRQVITVGGRVSSPGPVAYVRGMTLFNAVAAAGGVDAFGSDKRVKLIRKGKVSQYNIKESVEHMNIPVYPGDTINVPQKTVWGN